MKVRHVLVFPAGTEIGLEIAHALQYCKEVQLFGAGQDVSNHAKFAYPEFHALPSIYEPGWVEALTALCTKLSIDYIFPAYDDVIVALSREQHAIPAVVLSSSPEACEITRSKSQTYARLAHLVRVPRLYPSADAVPDSDFPVFVKPDRGQGSFGTFKANNRQELLAALPNSPSPLICELLPGAEYTVDCFSDRQQGLLFANPRSRRRTRNGISVNTITEDIPEAHAIAQRISQELKLYGAWFFQLKRAADGQLALLEVAPRIAGAMATHRVTGVNFPLLSIFEYERAPLHILHNPGTVEMDRALGNRYKHTISFQTVYIDLDDTLILNGKVNLLAIQFVFQCLNQGKTIKLITRHAGNLPETLLKYRLNGLFHEVIHLKMKEQKSSFISEHDAIFVDDSFSERFDVSSRCNIPTFDCSMLEIFTQQAESL